MKNKKNKTLKRIVFVLIFIVFLPIFIIEFLIKTIYKRIKYHKWRQNKYSLSNFIEQCEIEKIDIMEGYEFEQFLKHLFFYSGYKAEVTKKRGDYGADLILQRDGIVTIVQAKRYKGVVGIKAVQEIVAAKKHYNADETMVITNSFYSNEAEQIAKEQSVQLIDRHQLIDMINEVKLSIGQNDAVSKPFDNDTSELYKFRI